MLENELLAFIRHSIRSIWALEVLLLLRRSPSGLTAEAIVANLRSSPMLIARCLHQLSDAGLVSVGDDGLARYSCATLELARLCDSLAAAAQETPIALRDAIVSAPNDRLRNLADAFRFKTPDKKDKDE